MRSGGRLTFVLTKHYKIPLPLSIKKIVNVWGDVHHECCDIESTLLNVLLYFLIYAIISNIFTLKHIDACIRYIIKTQLQSMAFILWSQYQFRVCTKLQIKAPALAGGIVASVLWRC